MGNQCRKHRKLHRNWNIRNMHRALIYLASCAVVIASDFYVSTNGSPLNSGSIASPWSLQAALITNIVAPGDTIWLRSGTYSPPSTNSGSLNAPQWTVNVLGSSGNLITFRSYPGEVASIDRQWRFGSSAYLRFRDLELYDSYKGSNPTNISFPHGPWLHFDDSSSGSSSGNEWINCIIHDVDNCWSGSTAGSSVRGCIIWNVGLNGFEHVLYSSGSQIIGNICAWHMSEFVNLNSVALTIRSNIVFGSGQAGTGSQGGDTLMGGHNLDVQWNYFYNHFGTDRAVSSVFVDGGAGVTATINSNVLCGVFPLTFETTAFASVIIMGNTFHMSSPFQPYALLSRQNTGGSWTIDNNNYTAEPSENVVFDDNPPTRTFAQWRAAFPAFDANSTSTNSAFPVDSAHLIPNQDQAKRAHIAIYNWTHADNVTVTVSSVLTSGNTYQLYDAQNYSQGPIRTGTLSGSTITVPMTNLTAAPWLYSTNWGLGTPPPMSPEFGAFVLIGSDPAPFIRVVP